MQSFGRANQYTLVARGHLVEVLMELGQPVSRTQPALHLATSPFAVAFQAPWVVVPFIFGLWFGGFIALLDSPCAHSKRHGRMLLFPIH